MKTKPSPRLEQLEDRLTPSIFGQAWPDPGHLTLSFVPDGTNAGGAPSGLFNLLNSRDSTANWETAVLRAFQTWAVNTNVNVGVVNDNGLALGTTGAVQGDSRFGDVRIASQVLAPTAVSTASPFSWSGTTWAGDLLLNSAYQFGSNGQAPYDLYTIALHEAGHVFGLQDTGVSTDSAMYENYIGPRTGLSAQDIADVQSLYGVRAVDWFNRNYANNSFATAAPIGNDPSQLAFEADITQIGEVEYYKITTPATALLGTWTVKVQTSGLSLLVPSVSAYDASFNLQKSAAASDPLHGDLSITIDNVLPESTYYIKVSDATSSVFGIGSYRMYLSYHNAVTSLESHVVFPLVNTVGHLYDRIDKALPLLPTFGANKNKPDQRFDYVWRDSITDSTDQNFYQIQSPDAPTGTSFVMHAIAWEMDPNGLHPVVHVFDAQQQPIALQVLGNSDGMYSIQIPGMAPNATYYVEVAALDPNGSNNTGKYVLGIKFDANHAPVTLDTLDSNSLSSATSANVSTLVMNQNGLFHFLLGADNGGSSVAGAVLTLAIYDQSGNQVFTIDAPTGQPPSTGIVYLPTGTYTVRTSIKSSTGLFLPVNYWLRGEILSDPIGPYQTSTMNDSTSPTSGQDGSGQDGSGGGYTYSGSSSTSTTTCSPPNTY
jgi:Matrixin